jgi:hypothetical protein
VNIIAILFIAFYIIICAISMVNLELAREARRRWYFKNRKKRSREESNAQQGTRAVTNRPLRRSVRRKALKNKNKNKEK